MIKEFFQEIVDLLTPKYKVYTALLSQFGEDTPTAQIFINTIGDITLSRVHQGTFSLENSLFLEDKTFIVPPNPGNENDDGAIFKLLKSGDGIIYLNVTNGINAADNFNNVSVEIRVYQ